MRRRKHLPERQYESSQLRTARKLAAPCFSIVDVSRSRTDTYVSLSDPERHSMRLTAES